MFTFHLLDEGSESNLDRLERELEEGHLKCRGFERIFGRSDESQHRNPEMLIRDILAKVKAFEVLARSRFTHITGLERRNATIVDFTAQRNGRDYAIVVCPVLNQAMRTGAAKDRIIDSENKQQPSKIITEGVYSQYPKLFDFCQRSAGEFQGIIIISSGFDYLLAPSQGNWGRGLNARAAISVLRHRWTVLTEEGREDYKYLSHLVFVDNRSHWHVYPSFESFRR